jgi:hypothetical protein
MRSRSPTPPPPIQMALAKTGNDRRCIEFLSVMMTGYLPSISG